MPRLRPAPDDKEEKPVVAAAEPEIEVVAEPEVEVEVAEPEPKQDDATLALKKQIEDLRASERVLKERNEQFARDREEALERARQREAQIQKVQKEAYDSQADAISSALAAAQAEADKAQLDIENAISLGDAKGQAEAHRRLAMATSNLARLQEGKDAAEERAKEQPAPTGDPIDSWGYPKITSDWLKNHRHLLTGDSLDELRFYQVQAKKAGLTPHTPEFLKYIEVKIGERPEDDPEVVEAVEEAPKKKGPPVSAPVSRGVPDSSGKRPSAGKVTLTVQQQEAARISGISLEEYAKQMLKKQEMVASGEYGEQR